MDMKDLIPGCPLSVVSFLVGILRRTHVENPKVGTEGSVAIDWIPFSLN